MYDINKRKELHEATVAQLIEELAKLPPDTTVYCGGCGPVWLHVDLAKDGSAVNIDYDALDECYEED